MSLPSQAQIQSWWAPRCTGPWLTITLHGEGRVTVRPAIGDAVMALNACLRAWNYRTRRADTGAYNCRLKVGGNGWSMHAFATAPDINWSTNPYGPRLVTDMPAAMTRAITQIRTMSGAQVWQWGGYWRGNKDAMHFEIVCSPADIRSGIDPRTVPGHAFDPLPTPLPPKGAAPEPEPESEEDEDMAVVIRHHDGGVRLHRGGIYTVLNNTPSHQANADNIRYWTFLSGRAELDLSKDRAQSERWLNAGIEVSVLKGAAMNAAAAAKALT